MLDTDWAGTLNAFYRALKTNGLGPKDIRFVMATHYHPDHMGLVGSLTETGAGLLLTDVQKDAVHFSDRIFERDRLPFTPVCEENAAVISCGESRAFLAGLGIAGEIVHTPSHSADSVSRGRPSSRASPPATYMSPARMTLAGQPTTSA